MAQPILRFLKRHWLIILLTLIAGFFRLYRLESSLMFLGDQGRDALVMKRMLINNDLPFIGPITSVGGFYLGPLYYYLMAPFLWAFQYNPVGPAYATAILGIITIPVLFFITQKIFSKSTAFWASLLYVFAFIPISETRSAWNPNPMPLAALGLLYGFYLANYQKKPQGLILAFISLAVAFQLHYMIIFLAPFIFWQLILSWRQPKIRSKFFLALLAFLAIMSPLILFEIKNNFLNFKGLLEFLTKNEYSQLSLLQVFKDISGRAEQAIGMLLGFGRDFNVIRTWVTRIFLVGIIYLIFKLKKPSFNFLSLWLLSSIIALAVYHSNVYPHYLGFLFPIIFILTGNLLASFKKNYLFIPIAFFFLFSYFNLPQIQKLLTSQGNLTRVKQVASFINQDIQVNQHLKVNLALLDGTRDYRASNYRYFLELEQPNLLKFDQYPDTQTLYVISPYLQSDVLSSPQWEIRAVAPAEVIDKWEYEDSDKIYKIDKL